MQQIQEAMKKLATLSKKLKNKELDGIVVLMDSAIKSELDFRGKLTSAQSFQDVMVVFMNTLDKKMGKNATTSQVSSQMTKEEFLVKFEALYNETIRTSLATSGVRIADGKKMLQEMSYRYSIPLLLAKQYYETLREEEKIFAKKDTGVEIVLWVKVPKEMTYEEFEKKFETLYVEEKREQELSGVVAIHSATLCEEFAEKYSIPIAKVTKLFKQLKANKKVLAVMENQTELIRWAR